jgi:hypothetical protein
MSNPELTHPQPDESLAILAEFREQRVERLEADVQRQAGIIKALREQCTKATERADQAEYMLRAGGLSDVNAYMTKLKEQAELLDHKDQHIRVQGVIIASLRNQNKVLRSRGQVPQEWHEEPSAEREDLP